MNFNGLTISVPKEIMPGEKRVAVTPDTVEKMVAEGAKVLLEEGAGEKAFFPDELYIKAGAEIIPDARALCEKADLILKVKEPQYNQVLQRHEVESYPENVILISFLHPANRANHEMVKMLSRKNIISFTLDGIPRLPEAAKMDPLISMSAVAGYKAALFAANHMPRFVPEVKTEFETIKPAVYLVIGAGVAGMYAATTAKNLGARVLVWDIREEGRKRARKMGAEIIDLKLPERLEDSSLRLTEGEYEVIRQQLRPYVTTSDAVILTALIPGEEAPIIVDKAMVDDMKKGAVIVDISIDQGGNCELSRGGEEYDCNGITISAIKNIPATLAIDSTRMFANNVLQFLYYVVKNGKVSLDEKDPVIRGMLVTKDGKIVHKGTLQAMVEK